MAKQGLGPFTNPKGLLEIRGRRPASGESLVDLTDPQDGVQHLAGEARTLTNRYTSAMVNTSGRSHGDDPNIIWTEHSNVVSPNNLPNRGTEDIHGVPYGPTIGRPTKANPLGVKQPASLEE